MKTRFDVIQFLINNQNFKNYLEIGTRYAPESGKSSKDSITCLKTTGVDISNPMADYIMSSDEFFRTIQPHEKYDIIFIDGDHEKHQVLRDINNAIEHLTDNGCIVCHDINPPSESYLRPNRCHNAWETWAYLRSTRDDLEMYSLDIDWTGVIRKGKQVLYTAPIEYSWDFLVANKTQLLNIIDTDQFIKIFSYDAN